MKEIKLYKRPLKGLKIVALTVPFVVVGIWLISKGPAEITDYIMGWICSCFFGLGIPVGLFQTFDRRPQITITENGIRDRTTKQDVIKWEQIKSAYSLDVYKQRFVCLEIDDSLALKKNLYKWAAKLNERVGAQKINLSISQLKISENTMTNFINEIIAAEKENRASIIRKYFNN